MQEYNDSECYVEGTIIVTITTGSSLSQPITTHVWDTSRRIARHQAPIVSIEVCSRILTSETV